MRLKDPVIEKHEHIIAFILNGCFGPKDPTFSTQLKNTLIIIKAELIHRVETGQLPP